MLPGNEHVGPFTCPKCHHDFYLDNAQLGRKIQCPNGCGEVLVLSTAFTGKLPQSQPHQTRKEASIIDKAILGTFSRNLNREAHILINHPNLLWQQLFNRLQWEEEQVQKSLAAGFQCHTAQGAQPWMRTRTRPQESRALNRTLEGHTGSISHCAVSPDGHQIVSASSDKTLKIWDAISGAEKNTLVGHTDNVSCCAISPDNTFIVSGSWDHTLKLWDAASGFERYTIKTGSVNQCAVSQDSLRIISNGGADTQVWDANTGNLLYKLEGIRARFISDDGCWCVSVTDVTPKFFRNIEVVTKGLLHGPGDFQVTIWDVVNRKVKSKAILHGESQSTTIQALGISPDGRWMVTADQGFSKTLRIWDVEEGKIVRKLNNKGFQVNSCGFSPDGHWIVVAGFSASNNRQWIPAVQLWDFTSGKQLVSFTGHGRQISRLPTTIECVAFSPDCRWMVSAASDGTLKIWDITQPITDQPTSMQSTGVSDCNYSLDGQWLVTCGGNSLSLRDGMSHRMVNSWKKDQMEDCAIHPNGIKIMTTNSKQNLMDRYTSNYWVTLWEATSGKELFKLGDSSSTTLYRCGGFSPDGYWVITAGYGRNGDNVVVWDATSGQERLTLEGGCAYIEDLCISPNGQWVLSAGGATNNDLCLWNSATGNVVHHLTGHQDRVQACGFSTDSKWIISAGWDGALKIWDVSTGVEMKTFTGHTGKVNMCGFSSDGQHIVSAGDDQTIRLWDVATGMQIGLLIHISSIVSGAVHPLGPWFAFCDVGGNLNIVEIMC
jgi:WD40 repeat protein